MKKLDTNREKMLIPPNIFLLCGYDKFGVKVISLTKKKGII